MLKELQGSLDGETWITMSRYHDDDHNSYYTDYSPFISYPFSRVITIPGKKSYTPITCEILKYL